ncbi:hypothetical protein H6F79_27695 [Trichocoleus sp. FACHB-69]|nr:hypothetical protein [Trichocoleus sp. FACHB-69]
MSALVLSTGIKFGQSPSYLIFRGIFQIDRGIQVSVNLDARPLALKTRSPNGMGSRCLRLEQALLLGYNLSTSSTFVSYADCSITS